MRERAKGSTKMAKVKYPCHNLRGHYKIKYHCPNDELRGLYKRGRDYISVEW